MWRMPAFMARAQARTSGTKMKFSLNLIPTMPIPAIKPSSMTSMASMPCSKACRGKPVDIVMLGFDQRSRYVLHPGTGTAEQLDVATDLLGPFEVVLYLEPDGLVGYVGQFRHGLYVSRQAAEARSACHSRTVFGISRRFSMGV